MTAPQVEKARPVGKVRETRCTAHGVKTARATVCGERVTVCVACGRRK